MMKITVEVGTIDNAAARQLMGELCNLSKSWTNVTIEVNNMTITKK